MLCVPRTTTDHTLVMGIVERFLLKFYCINLIQDRHLLGLLTDRGAKKASLPKTCHTYPTMMKLGTVIPYLKKIQKKFE